MSVFRTRSWVVGLALGAAFLGCASDPAGSSSGGGAGASALPGAGALGQSGSVATGAAAGSGGAPSTAGSAGSAVSAAGNAGNLGGAGGASHGGASGASAGGVAGKSGAGASGAGAGGAAGKGGAGAAQGGGAGAGGALSNVTIWIAGDSTVATGGPCPIGWGGRIKALFNSKVTVTNSAVAGRSVRTWLYDVQDSMDSTGECNLGEDSNGAPTLQAHWSAMLTGMKAGDYLFIQFGINDGDSTCPRHVGQDAFESSYAMMAQAAKDRGAFPIFVTPVSQIACNGSTVSKGTREPYVTATKAVGAQSDVPVLDLNALSVALYQSLGFCPIPGGDVSATTTGAVGTFFCDDHTHFDTTGADQIAKLVTGALKSQNIPLAQYLL